MNMRAQIKNTESRIEFTDNKGKLHYLTMTYYNKHKNEKFLQAFDLRITDNSYLLEQQKEAIKPKTETPQTPEIKSDIPDFANMSVKKIKGFLIDKKPELDEVEYRYMNKEELINYAISKCK